jgi:hypothetical protein
MLGQRGGIQSCRLDLCTVGCRPVLVVDLWRRVVNKLPLGVLLRLLIVGL